MRFSIVLDEEEVVPAASLADDPDDQFCGPAEISGEFDISDRAGDPELTKSSSARKTNGGDEVHAAVTSGITSPILTEGQETC